MKLIYFQKIVDFTKFLFFHSFLTSKITVWKLREFSLTLTHFWQKFRQSNVFTKEITEEIIWRNIPGKLISRKFCLNQIVNCFTCFDFTKYSYWRLLCFHEIFLEPLFESNQEEGLATISRFKFTTALHRILSSDVIMKKELQKKVCFCVEMENQVSLSVEDDFAVHWRGVHFNTLFSSKLITNQSKLVAMFISHWFAIFFDRYSCFSRSECQNEDLFWPLFTTFWQIQTGRAI